MQGSTIKGFRPRDCVRELIEYLLIDSYIDLNIHCIPDESRKNARTLPSRGGALHLTLETGLHCNPGSWPKESSRSVSLTLSSVSLRSCCCDTWSAAAPAGGADPEDVSR